MTNLKRSTRHKRAQLVYLTRDLAAPYAMFSYQLCPHVMSKYALAWISTLHQLDKRLTWAATNKCCLKSGRQRSVVNHFRQHRMQVQASLRQNYFTELYPFTE